MISTLRFELRANQKQVNAEQFFYIFLTTSNEQISLIYRSLYEVQVA